MDKYFGATKTLDTQEERVFFPNARPIVHYRQPEIKVFPPPNSHGWPLPNRRSSYIKVSSNEGLGNYYNTCSRLHKILMPEFTSSTQPDILFHHCTIFSHNGVHILQLTSSCLDGASFLLSSMAIWSLRSSPRLILSS